MFGFKDCYMTHLSSLSAQTMSLSILDFVGLLEDGCLSSCYFSQEKPRAPLAGQVGKNPTEQISFSVYLWG